MTTVLAPSELLRYHNRRFENRIIGEWPGSVQRFVMARFEEILKSGERIPGNASEIAAANVFLHDKEEEFKGSHIHHAFNEDAIRDYAENYARTCSKIVAKEKRIEFAINGGIKLPKGKWITAEGNHKRLETPLFWRGQLRRIWTRGAENSMRDLGIVRKGRQPYASDEAVKRRRAQKAKTRLFFDGHDLVNELGERLPLAALAEHSLANPAVRRVEFMVRVKGCDEYAGDRGHVCDFGTFTVPSRFHAQIKKAGRNPKHIKETVREAQEWLTKNWACLRAKVNRNGLIIYGFRIAEPHHDGTPHWHMLIFGKPEALDLFNQWARVQWLKKEGDEPGAANIRIKFQRMNPAKGSAVGYLAKYVAKNIDGAGEIGLAKSDETGRTVREECARVDAWAATHGIRQFQQIGGPAVGLWREFRLIREEPEDADLARVWKPVEAGDFRTFIHEVGGIECGRRTNPRLIQEETGEVNKYGECKAARTMGVCYASAREYTRPHSWRITQKEGRCVLGTAMLREMPAAGETALACKKRGDSVFPSPSVPPLGPVAIIVRMSPEEQRRLIALSPQYLWIATASFSRHHDPPRL